LDAFKINWYVETLSPPGDAEELVIAGGGNMGAFYGACAAIRRKALATGKPVTVLPQSYTGPEVLPYHRVFVRERASLTHCPHALLAPDLALGLDWETSTSPTHEVGVWLRLDAEACFPNVPSRGDPILHCRTWQEYLGLAANHARVVTDRLHFAIAALLCRRAVTLLPNRYHKNRAMYETWLRDLGCSWADEPPIRDEPRRNERAGLSRRQNLKDQARGRSVLVLGHALEPIVRSIAATADRVVVYVPDPSGQEIRALRRRLRGSPGAKKITYAAVALHELPLVFHEHLPDLVLVAGMPAALAEETLLHPLRPHFGLKTPCFVLDSLPRPGDSAVS
jgi:hypothetical protein